MSISGPRGRIRRLATYYKVDLGDVVKIYNKTKHDFDETRGIFKEAAELSISPEDVMIAREVAEMLEGKDEINEGGAVTFHINSKGGYVPSANTWQDYLKV
jgi:hypothetical protein